MWGREGTLAVAFRTHTSMFHNLHDSVLYPHVDVS
jgi:hypothetical protein